jgi:acetyl-CoA carboxylase carboxyl transferase subunit beta
MSFLDDQSVAPLIPTGDTKLEIPKGLWTNCPSCKEMLYAKELATNQQICRYCDHHFPIDARDRLEGLLNADSFEEHDAGMTSVDVLKFTGTTSYIERLRHYQKKTGLCDAVVSGWGQLEGHRLSVAVMDFGFIGGSMGTVVGEKITRAIERATAAGLPVLIVSASGGARMHEGMFSLMQMAKTSGALARQARAKLPFLSLLTHPTMGGVTASFASLGDIIIAEPKAMIGFAGARVIKETTHQELPKGFQTAEFLLEKGLVDMIVPRLQLRATLDKLLTYLQG